MADLNVETDSFVPQPQLQAVHAPGQIPPKHSVISPQTPIIRTTENR